MNQPFIINLNCSPVKSGVRLLSFGRDVTGMMTLKVHFLLTTLLLLNAGTAMGVECPPRTSLADAFSRATAVFSGKVIAEEYRTVDFSASGGVGVADVLVVKFKVERWWKGGTAKNVVLYTSVMRMPNGLISIRGEDFGFRKGENYLVYAYGPADKLRTSACNRTSALSHAEWDLRELGEGRAPKGKPE